MKKLSELSLRSITIIQSIVALIISLIFQFIIPLAWQPLDAFEWGNLIHHGDEGTNVIIFSVSQWYFSFSISWHLRRDNKYINNFLVYSIPGLSSIVFIEFFFYGLYYDYIHLITLATALYIIAKKGDSLIPKHVIPNFIFVTIWLFSVYFLRLAYFNSPLVDYFLRWVITSVANFGIWCVIVIMQRKRVKRNRNSSKF
ncbi:MAG: hypothetical protein KGD66_10785 [Candidatus Lokiarchaeota archaeon]|nr:hypothetical protein [Candidatus Lokiarchaeota archaeon]